MAPLRRRTVFRLAGAASIGGTVGCLGTLPGQPEDDDPDPADDAENSDDEDADTELDIPACPEKPGSLTEENVAAYATQYEEARVIKLALSGTTKNVTWVNAKTSNVNVSAVEDGWTVRFDATEAYLRWEDGHYDPAIHPVAYFVNDTAVRRAVPQEQIDEPLHPREEGKAVECPPT